MGVHRVRVRLVVSVERVRVQLLGVRLDVSAGCPAGRCPLVGVRLGVLLAGVRSWVAGSSVVSPWVFSPWVFRRACPGRQPPGVRWRTSPAGWMLRWTGRVRVDVRPPTTAAWLPPGSGGRAGSRHRPTGGAAVEAGMSGPSGADDLEAADRPQIRAEDRRDTVERDCVPAVREAAEAGGVASVVVPPDGRARLHGLVALPARGLVEELHPPFAHGGCGRRRGFRP
jgi:hypothetical protein